VPLDDPVVRQTLEALSLCYDQYDGSKDTGLTGLARHRDVRGDMQECTMQLDVEFARSLGMVDQVFEQLETSLDRVDQQCKHLRALVDQALRATAEVAQVASVVDDERRELALREQLAVEFVRRFSPDEAQARRLLRSPLAVDTGYFEALESVEAKRSECLKIMGAGQTAVRDLADELQMLESRAFDNLLRWLIDQVRELGRMTPDVDRWMRVALDKLRSHAALFDAGISEIARVRCEVLGREFIVALTTGGGGPGVLPRPIEAHAGDPQRYVGDMLAWVHQSCASEKEFFDALGLHQECAHMLAVALTSVARPLEIRVVQTTREMNMPVALYRVYSLLAFYHVLFNALFSTQSQATEFMDTIGSLARGTRAMLVDALERMADLVIGDFENVTTVLEAPASLGSLLQELSQIVRLHADDSLALATAEENTMQSSKDDIVDDITDILNKLIDEAQFLTDAAVIENNSGVQLRQYERSLFELNVLATVREAMANEDTSNSGSVGVLASWMPVLAQRQDAASSRLCDHLVNILKERSKLPFNASADILFADVQAFNGVLKMATDLDVTRLVSRLKDHALARSIAQSVVHSFVAEYAQLYDRICQENTTDQNILSALLSPDTVSTLL
ncbi:Golgi transport complex subunit 6, partial [Coemansia asiatica]